MPMNKPERELLKRLRQGDPKAFEEFVEKYTQAIYGEVRSLIKLGVVPPKEKDREWEAVLSLFISYIKYSDPNPDNFTVRQLIHVLAVYHAFSEYLLYKRYGRRLGLWRLASKENLPPSLDLGTSALVAAFAPVASYWDKPSLLKAISLQGNQFLNVDDAPPLTAHYLSSVLVPYIEAISSMQQVCNDVLGRPHRDVIVKQISQLSPTDIKLVDAAEAINAVKEDIIPWRKKHAQEVAKLKEQELAADVKKKELEAVEMLARSLRQDEREHAEVQKLEAEAAKMREEAEQMRLENKKRRFELQRVMLELAVEIVSKLKPGLPIAEQYAHAVELLPSIDKLATSEIEPSLLLP